MQANLGDGRESIEAIVCGLLPAQGMALMAAAARVPQDHEPMHVQLMLAVRRRHNWSQDDLARALQVSRSTIIRWESGDDGTQPRIYVLAALRELLNE